MSEETAGAESVPEDWGAGVDPIAVALALGGASQERAALLPIAPSISLRHFVKLALAVLFVQLPSIASADIQLAASTGQKRAVSEVWAREDDYLRLSDGGTLEEKQAMFDERFRGWSCRSALPGNKAGLTAPQELRGATREREGETVADGQVTVFYRLHSSGPNGTEVVRDFIHTWAHRGNVWKIVSGMCRIEG